jgi:hypothetical protein
MTNSNKRNFDTLQLLRGIAAMLVVFYHGTHTDFLGFFKFGYMGVDLFFVLSGFIILYIHFTDFGVKHRLTLFTETNHPSLSFVFDRNFVICFYDYNLRTSSTIRLFY